MSTSKQQTLTNSGANERPPMLEKGNYIPWESSADYEDEYQGELQGDSQEDNLTSAMKLLAQAITQKFSIPTNNRLHTSSNTRNQAVIQDGRVDIQTKNTGYGGNGNRNAGRQNRNQAFNVGIGNDESNQIKPRVRDARYFREQMLLAMKDESGSNLQDEENDFMLDNSYGDETLEESTAVVIMMARIQPADDNAASEPSYDAKSVSEKLSSQDRIVYKMGQSIQTIHMLGKEPNKVYDPFLKAGLGSKNHKRLKKAIVAQPKMYDDEMLYSTSFKIDSPDSEETLEDAEESRLKMRNKMVKLNYEKLNALYETFVPQQEPSAEQTYFSIPSTSNDSSETKEVTSDLLNPQMPKESKLLKMFEKIGLAINDLQTRIDVTLLEDRKRRWISDSQNSLREFYKTNVISMSESLSTTLKELQQELIDEVDSIVKERENIKLEYQKLFNSVKATLTQHQKYLDELIEHVNQKTYAYADVRAHNQDLLMTIFELKNKLKTIDKEKNVNTKFDKFETWGTLLCVTPLPKNIAVKAKKVSNTKVNPDRSKPVTSHSIPKNEQSKKTKCECNRVESSNSVRRPKSKDNKSKDRVLKNTNDKRPSIHVRSVK
ncbi:hypothetical protein Tco_1438145 [Tanacetum coccineum]